jgi:tRNA-specific 2-thiouridylase
MSGGVDSSVAAHLLRSAGHDVVGVFMRHGDTTETACATASTTAAANSLPVVTPRLDHKQGCCTAADAADARRVADRLDIPFYALDFHDEFGRIIDYFVDEYTNARTPNPCVVCNNWLKFGKLFDYADSIGAEFVATGHYARIASSETLNRACPPRRRPAVAGREPRTLNLLRGLDSTKDQSYVLFGIARDYLPRMLLPIGGYRKDQIRELASDIGLRVADKPDSQEICFVTTGDHADFVRRRRGDSDTAGEIVTTDGRVVGHHDGIESFTIGQRRGLGIAFGEPRYVVRLEADTRRVIVGTKDELARDSLTANRANWLVDPLSEKFRCEVQIRYNSTAAPATVELLSDDRFHVTFDEPRHGVAPGQAAVCYDGDRVLGGGWIE